MDLDSFVRLFLLIPAFPAVVIRYLLPKSSTEIFVEQLRKNELSPNERYLLTIMHLSVLPQKEVELFGSDRPITADDVRTRMIAINPVQQMMVMSKYVVLASAAGFMGLVYFLKRGASWKSFMYDLGIINLFIYADTGLRGGRVCGDMRMTREYKKMVYGIGK